jgi:hypothetical protein
MRSVTSVIDVWKSCPIALIRGAHFRPAVSNTPMSTIRLPRSWLATAISCVLHVALGAALVFLFAAPDSLAAASSSSGSVMNRRGTMQLRGDQRERPEGRDLLYEILSARDGVKVRLTSPSGEPAVGLAWWSSSRGMWLAVDLANAHAGETLQAWLNDDDGSRTRLASVEIGADGSGRIVTTWDEDDMRGHAGPITLTLTSPRGPWPFSRTPIVLRGAGQP